jgi:ribosomal protein S18 acetylase RimI-like enzyme
MDWKIVDAGAAGWQDAAELHTLSWKTAYRGIVSDAYLENDCANDRRTVWSGRAKEWDPAKIVLLIARQDDGLALGMSCAAILPDDAHGVLLDNLHVRPDLKRGGIGRALIAATGRWVAAHVPGKPMYLTVYKDNTNAVAFYRRMGGEEADAGIYPFKDGTSAPILRFTWREPAKIAG